MLFFFFIFGIMKRDDHINPYFVGSGTLGEEKISPNKKCLAKHTRKSKTKLGRCECEPGYPYGDPNLATGCFKCSQQCAENAFCGYPGKCICNPGFSGDGSKECIPLPPVLVSVSPEFAIAYKRLEANITFETDPRADFKVGFLKLRSNIYTCHLLKKGLFNCTIPNVGKSGTVEFHLSFDNQTWSKEYVEFQILAPEIGDIAIYFFISLIVGGVAFGVYRTKRKVKKIDPETIPFLFSASKEIN